MGWFEERFLENSNKFKFNCQFCSKPMWFPKSKFGVYITCGKDCQKKLNQKKKQLRAKNCLTCNKIFYPRNNQIINGNGIFCSQKCNTNSHNAMNSKEAQAKSKAKWKETNAITPIIKKGKDHPSWKGGWEASYKRLREQGKTKIYWANRIKKGVGKKIDKKIVTDIGNHQKWKCIVCLCNLKKYEIDHIQPIHLGGNDDKFNLQLLCVSCNRKKSYKDPIKFMQEKGYLL
jgi:hypothetical protein